MDMKHIVSFSGGKDSTAMLLMMIEKGMQIDDIIFCDTGKEFPEIYEHIKQVEQYIKRPITVLKADKSFDYYMLEHIKTKGKNKGKRGYGWATPMLRWCTNYLKRNVMNKYLKSLKGDYVTYIGIAYDEPKRHANISDNVIHPLYDWKVTEKQALQYCYDKGFSWGGCYDNFKRLSCYCCPLQRISEWRILRDNYPDLWKDCLDMESKSYNTVSNRFSLFDLEKRFEMEDILGKELRGYQQNVSKKCLKGR